MIAVLDACVLFPTILREILTDAAEEGLYRAVWSERILREWTRAAARPGPVDADIASAEAAALRDRFPDAAIEADEDLARGLDLPDPADRHVVAAAMQAEADQIVTFNLRDFPRPAMSAAGLRAIHPDAFLTGLWAENPDILAGIVVNTHAKAIRLGSEMELRSMLKRARLPRLGKALTR
ncbi:RSP_2648 family PIN domain-containing protein [Paracoccus aerodenitrificans]|uniref:RSP_2648 family PIN domain-containing protein n=1 Tax=Paracoccus aerodenitrificans TaxID=3017781 RepID=UPI0022F0CC14|nr:PIN domain-containing protein [Paracoccus aerodenitrificans]WBU65056.1 PIN domain-containing protein [Paracoccus aerodenitrificans]